MLPYILTAIAGIAMGVVSMRIWSSRNLAAIGGVDVEPASHLESEDSAVKAPNSPFGRLCAKLTHIRPSHLLILAAVLVAAALASFGLQSGTAVSSSGYPSFPAGAAGSQADQLDDVDTMIERLASRLEENPEDGEGYRMLGWSYVMTGRPEQAIAPYERALELIPEDPSVHAGYGEALVAIADNKVTPAARSAFKTAVRIDPAQPRARYFLALWDAQNGKEQKALDSWVELANSGPVDAPWQADVRREIARVSNELGVDVSKRLAQTAASAELPTLNPATVQASQKLPEVQRQAMIDDMVEGLAARLVASPADPDGWVRLLRSRMVLEQENQAATDLQSARAALRGDSAGIAMVDAAASELGVPGA